MLTITFCLEDGPKRYSKHLLFVFSQWFCFIRVIMQLVAVLCILSWLMSLCKGFYAYICFIDEVIVSLCPQPSAGR